MYDDKLKIKLARKILSLSDTDLLERIAALLGQSHESDIVSLSSSGNPLTLTEYNNMLAAAEEDIDKGRILSTSELRDKLKGWQESRR